MKLLVSPRSNDRCAGKVIPNKHGPSKSIIEILLHLFCFINKLVTLLTFINCRMEEYVIKYN